MTFKVFALLVICQLLVETIAQPASGVRRPNEFLEPPPLPRRGITRLQNVRHSTTTTSTTPTPSTKESDKVSRNARWFFSSEESDSKSTGNEILRPPPPPPSPPSRANSSPPVRAPSPVPTRLQPIPPQEPIASETHPHHSIVAPGPSHHQQQSKGKECNPCNKVPWIPMIHPHGSSDVHPALPSQYDSPSIASLPLQAPGSEYGAPLPPLQTPNHNYGPPLPPKQEYGPPQQPPKHQYGPPPQPPKQEYGPPKQEYGPPPQQAKPLRPEYGPPSQPPKDQYGPPPPPQQPPKFDYGLPPPPVQPIKHEYSLPPPPPPQSNLEYLPPSKHEYHPQAPPPPPPQLPNIQYHSTPQHPKDQYGLPPPPPPQPPRNEYGPPPQPPKVIPVHENHQSPPRQGPTSFSYQTLGNFGPPNPPSSEYKPPLSPNLHQSQPEFRPPPPPQSYDAIKQPSLPQLAPSYLPAPPVYEANNFKDTSQSENNYLIPPPFTGERGTGGHIDVVPSITLIQDSHPVASHHPTSGSQHETSYTGVSSIHLVPESSTSSGFNSAAWQKEETTHPPNDQLLLPSGDTYHPQGQHSKPVQTRNPDPSLEVIPSIQVADYVSSIEYPLQIVQAPYIDVTSPFETNQKTQSTSYSHSSSFDEGEIIVGKPNLAASSLNDSKIHTQNTTDFLDQKQQQSAIHETNTGGGGPPVIEHPASSGVIRSSTGNGYFVSENQIKHTNEDHQEGQSQLNINVLNAQGQTSTGPTTTVEIQPSIQTSAEGNSIIHQINNAFQSHTSPSLPNFHNNFKSPQSGYVLFQNFPQPPLSYLPADVLKQKLPPPTPFQSTLGQHPYLPPFQPIPQSSHNFFQSTPPPTTTSFEHALRLEAPESFLNPPPKDNGEYSTVSNTFWSPTPRPYVTSPKSGGWGSTTTVAPLKYPSQKPISVPNQNIITAFAEAAGLLPPPPQTLDSSNQSNKKMKQIQIIVPYTSSKDLMQFKVQNENKPIFDSSGWLPITGNEQMKLQGRKVSPSEVNCTDNSESWQSKCRSNLWQQNDFHQNQETRTVTATAPLAQSVKHITQGYPQKSYSEIQHIFATNIRDLLRGEEDNKKIPDSVTLQRLQKNIDEWTALEYSKRRDLLKLNSTKHRDDGKKSTTLTTSHQHLLLPSKKIPEEYLTTTPITFDDSPQTENYVATAIPSYKKSRSTTASPIFTSTSSSFRDHQASASHSHTVRTVTSTSFETSRRKIKDKQNADNSNAPNHQRKGENHRWRIIESNFIIPQAVSATTEITTSTSTQRTTSTTPPTTTTVTTEPVTDFYSNAGHTTWDQLPLSISPITNEKVYVVTPVTTWRPDTTPTTSINDIFPFRNGPPAPQKLIKSAPFSFKSPRFIIRPTPGTTIHRMFTLTSLEDDDDLASVKSTTFEPIKSNEVDDYSDVGHNVTTVTPSEKDLLLGHPTLPTYTPPNGTQVRTDSGHSKVVTVVHSATVATPVRKRPNTKKQTTVATTKLFPVTSARPQPRGGIRKERPNRGSYAWQFPELADQVLSKEDAEAVKDVVVELQKNKT